MTNTGLVFRFGAGEGGCDMNAHEGPLAHSIRRLRGDRRGNDAIDLWRCALCEGLFIAPDVESFENFMLGYINATFNPIDDLNQPSELDTLMSAVALVGANPCRCGYHAAWWRRTWPPFLPHPDWILQDEQGKHGIQGEQE